MKVFRQSFLAAALVAVAAFAISSMTLSPVAAVPCPPPSGPITGIFCGGIAAIECPGNLVCIDDPWDNCCPEAGGADCGGVCAPKKSG